MLLRLTPLDIFDVEPPVWSESLSSVTTAPRPAPPSRRAPHVLPSSPMTIILRGASPWSAPVVSGPPPGAPWSTHLTENGLSRGRFPMRLPTDVTTCASAMMNQ